jgi:molybdopterin synthase catalytic subunit
MKIAIQTEDFDVSAELKTLRTAQVGALVSFVGTVREATSGSATGVTALELEHYPGMTEKSLTAIAQQATDRWNLNDVLIIHRVGKLAVTDQIVLVAVASQHRGAAFSACEFIMDYLKTEAPFWKKETGAQGSCWVDARSTDLHALDKWI